MKIYILLSILAIMFACTNSTGDHNITVKIIDTEYEENNTYLLVKGKGQAFWIASKSVTVAPGDNFTYSGGRKMKNYYSAGLDRTFDEIIFLDDVGMDQSPMKEEIEELSPGSMLVAEKVKIEIDGSDGDMTIAQLYANKETYNGKTVRVSGEVTKFNPEIMGRNWVHLQDGTDHNGKFDLTATSAESFVVGTKVILEGVLAIDQDFGYGYRYELLLESSRSIK